MTKLWEGLAISMLAVLWIALAVYWDALPEEVPAHFNAAGQPNRWGDRSVTLLLPSVGAVLYLLLTVITYTVRRFNAPFPVDQDSPEVRAEFRQMLTAVKAMVLVLFTSIHVGGLAVATGQARTIGWMPLMLAFGGIPGVILYYVRRLSRYRQDR